MRRSSSTRLVYAALIAANLGGASACASVNIYELGTLGGADSWGTSVNSSGEVAGYSGNSGSRASFTDVDHAFVYSGVPGSGGTMHDLGTLGGTTSAASGINASGAITGGASLPNDAGGYLQHAFLYTGTPGSGGAMVDLGTLGGRDSGGLAINASGQIAGYSDVSVTVQDAFRYSGTPGAGGVMQDLGGFGGPVTEGAGINKSGDVAGFGSFPGNQITHAFLYTGTPNNGGAMHDLGTLGGTNSMGNAINDNDEIAGSSNLSGNTIYHAFLYTGSPGNGGAMHDLGTLGGPTSLALGINSSGQVVGTSNTATSTHAFLYKGTPGTDGVMIDLDAWLHANDPDTQWTLHEALAITDTGLITGDGFYGEGSNGQLPPTRAFLLDASSLIPEPATLSLLPVAALYLLARRPRKTARFAVSPSALS